MAIALKHKDLFARQQKTIPFTWTSKNTSHNKHSFPIYEQFSIYGAIINSLGTYWLLGPLIMNDNHEEGLGRPGCHHHTHKLTIIEAPVPILLPHHRTVLGSIKEGFKRMLRILWTVELAIRDMEDKCFFAWFFFFISPSFGAIFFFFSFFNVFTM